MALSYLGNYRKMKTIRAENQIDGVWQKLLILSDINYLKKVWKSMEDEDYIYVSTSLKQSHDYYIASKTISMKTRPLLLYYCFLNLTKAVLYMKTDKKPSKYHGLCKENIDKRIEDSNDVLNFSVESNNGIFRELAEAFNYTIPVGQKYIFKDFIKNNIELYRDCIDYFGIVPLFIFPSIDGYSDNHLKITFDKRVLSYFKVSDEEITEKFKNKLAYKVESTDDKLVYDFVVSNEKLDFKEFSKKVIELISDIVSYSVFDDGRYYINLAPQSDRIPNANTYFGIMYILSSIVRYKPEHIYNLIDNKDTSIEWFIRRVCDVAERVYPNIMINLLHRVDYIFTSV